MTCAPAPIAPATIAPTTIAPVTIVPATNALTFAIAVCYLLSIPSYNACFLPYTVIFVFIAYYNNELNLCL